jgi:apolipoprotein N-acyltransferase
LLKYNSALLISPDGSIRSGFDKILLVPFAESLTFGDSLRALFPHAQDFGRADATPPLVLGAWRMATPICYEAAVPGFVRRMVEEAQPNLLVMLSNDAWFGDSQEPWIHLAVARMRAIEHHRFVVRATNSGVSAVIDPAGRLVTRSGLLTRENLRGTVRAFDGETLYGRAGDWLGWLAAAATAAMAFVAAPGSRPA